MFGERQQGKGKGRHRFEDRQRGFTLIELVAVMGILAILVAIVAPAATNMQDASVRAQARSDSRQVENATNDFFKDQEDSEVGIPHSITTTAFLSDGTGAPGDLGDVDSVTSAQVIDVQQEVSSKWPEVFITEDGAPSLATRSQNSKYLDVFQTASKSDEAAVDKLILLDPDGNLIDGAAFLADHIAIDMQLLVDGGYLSSKPDAEKRTSDAGSNLDVPNFLWLFEKTNSSGGTDDAREVKVFQLVKISQDETPNDPGTTSRESVDLTYRQIV